MRGGGGGAQREGVGVGGYYVRYTRRGRTLHNNCYPAMLPWGFVPVPPAIQPVDLTNKLYTRGGVVG